MTTTTPRAIARDLRRLAATPGHQLTDAYRDGLRLLAGEVSRLAEPATVDQPPVDNPLAVELRGILAGLDGDPNSTHLHPVVRERLRRLIEHVERLGVQPATAELEAVACGLEPEQECRAQAALALGWRSPGDTDTDEYRDWWMELDRLAAWIRTGARP